MTARIFPAQLVFPNEYWLRAPKISSLNHIHNGLLSRRRRTTWGTHTWWNMGLVPVVWLGSGDLDRQHHYLLALSFLQELPSPGPCSKPATKHPEACGVKDSTQGSPSLTQPVYLPPQSHFSPLFTILGKNVAPIFPAAQRTEPPPPAAWSPTIPLVFQM